MDSFRMRCGNLHKKIIKCVCLLQKYKLAVRTANTTMHKSQKSSSSRPPAAAHSPEVTW